MAVTQKPTIDFTLMYATHDAFRRDVERMLSAAVAGTAHDPRVRAGWDNFKTQLLLHHTVEDTHLWPRLRQAVAGQPDDVALVDDMEAEHARIDPLLADLDDALAGDPGSLAGHVRQLAATLDDHLTHEEDAALPLIQATLTATDWRAFRAEMRRQQGVAGAAVYVPWVIDGHPEPQQHRFLAQMPAPVRMLNRLMWQRRYRRRNLWGR